MINTNLPRGLKYKIDKVRPGIIIPGTDNEPIITISGRGAMIQESTLLLKILIAKVILTRMNWTV